MPTKVLNPNNAMGASGPGHAPGFVPDPGPTAGTKRFLREDATFAQPDYSDFTGTPAVADIEDASGNLTIGLVSGEATFPNTAFFNNGATLSGGVLTLPSQAAHAVFAGPASGTAAPTFRALAASEVTNAADLSNTGSQTFQGSLVISGTTTLAADPTTNLQAATKQYVDGKFAGGFSGSVPLAKLTTGGLDGSLTIVNGIITAVVNPS